MWKACLAAVFLAVVLTYANAFDNDFHFDDFHSINDNTAVRSLANVPRFFTDGTLSSVLRANQTYRPIVSVSLAVDYALGHGYVPFWFHLGTFVVFLAQLAAMFALFVTIGARAPAAFDTRLLAVFAVAFYGLHPAIAETVNYIIQRADIYSTFGVVVGLWLYARYSRLRRFGLYLIPVALALLSKPPAVVFPLVLFAYVWLFEEEARLARLRVVVLRTIPAFALSIASLVLDHVMIPKTFAPSILSPASYIVMQPYVLLRYAIAFFAPLNLSVDTDLQPLSWTSPDVLLGDVFLIALVACIYWTARRPASRPVAFGLAWFLIADIPTAVFPLSELENDHRMFFPFVGMVFAVSWAVAVAIASAVRRGALRLDGNVARIGIVLVLGVCALGTHARNDVWRTNASLWDDAARKSPHNGRALMNDGLEKMAVGNYSEARGLFERAALETPNYATLEINRGILDAAVHEDASAKAHFTRAIALAPTDDGPHFYYAQYLGGRDRTQAALREAEAALERNPASIATRRLAAQEAYDSGD